MLFAISPYCMQARISHMHARPHGHYAKRERAQADPFTPSLTHKHTQPPLFTVSVL